MDFSNIKELYIPEGKVKSITFPDGSSYTFGSSEPVIDYSNEPLTIESMSDNNTISYKISNASATIKPLQYSIDKENWINVSNPTTSGTTITTLNTGDKIYLRGTDSTGFRTGSYYNYLASTGEFKIYGNIMSLANLPFNTTDISSQANYLFGYIFNNCTGLKDISELVLPATTLKEGCYQRMFYGCTGLTSVPSGLLPATTLANNCYNGIFYSCSNLTSAPDLPATTLKEGCYQYMFYNCSNLTSAPDLPATTLTEYCYQYMFYNCSNLTTAPVLPATALRKYSYYQMFYNCSKLNYIKMMATNINYDGCLYNWVRGVASWGIFVKNSSATWTTTGVNGIPSGWTVQKVAA